MSLPAPRGYDPVDRCLAAAVTGPGLAGDDVAALAIDQPRPETVVCFPIPVPIVVASRA
jgi:hypothetical protein